MFLMRTTKQQARAMFEAERPFLLPLPATRFEYYRICERTVHFDGYIEFDSASREFLSAFSLAEKGPRTVWQRGAIPTRPCGSHHSALIGKLPRWWARS